MDSENVLSAGTSSFYQLAKSRLIVDKSSAIQDFLETHYPVHVLLRPRRSGKTTLLAMFEAFFQRGNPAELRDREQLFLDNNLAVTRNTKYMQSFGTCPVLYVNLSIRGNTFQELHTAFQERVRVVVVDLQKRGLLTNRDELDDVERTFLTQVMNRTLPADEWPEALHTLTTILHTIHHRDVIVLIDEYDTPAAYASEHGYFSEANDFFSKVFQALLKNNRHLRGALVVGIMRVAKASWFSGANNLAVYTLGDSGRYSKACMFTEAETRLLYERRKSTQPAIPFTLADLSKWYSGYHSGDGERLYNPYSLAMALQEGKLDCYWAESGYHQVILERFHVFLSCDSEFRRQIDQLLTNEPVYIVLDKGMTYHPIPQMSTIQLWTLLFSAGYLTRRMVSDDLPDGTDYDVGNSSCTDSLVNDISNGGNTIGGSVGDVTRVLDAQIPNYEIKHIFRRWLRDHLTNFVNHSGKKATCMEIFRNMVSGSMAKFAKKFMSMIWTSMPTPFLGSKECMYQAFVCGFFTVASQFATDGGEWTLAVEDSSGIGRFDFRLHHKTEAIIHEYRRTKMSKRGKRSPYNESKCGRLTKEAKDALEQIDNKGYRAQLPNEVTSLREYGIAFLGPYCAIVGHSFQRVPGGQWKLSGSYCAERNERNRVALYTVAT